MSSLRNCAAAMSRESTVSTGQPCAMRKLLMAVTRSLTSTTVHCPALHPTLAGHGLSQPPQWLGFVSTRTHAVPHVARGGRQPPASIPASAPAPPPAASPAPAPPSPPAPAPPL